MYFFDSHAHIQRSTQWRTGRFRTMVQKATEVGLRAILVPAVSADDWGLVDDPPASEGLIVLIALGLHPYFVCEITLERSNSLLEELEFRVLGAGSKLHAIGECGLDFRRSGADQEVRDRQISTFRGQLELARRVGLPLTIHCVKAHAVMQELLLERPTPPSVMHAYSGSAEMARPLIAAGHYVSFAGNLCIANARKVIEAARSVPRERLLIETDTPDQTPPGRGDVDNEPAFIVDIAARLAEVRGESLAEIAAATTDNACRLFGVKALPP
ncbi:MAG: TatD family hydrolase [Myxococcales bacterium]|nr:TatD family hydrolase [Myxococcales bacterium]